MTPKEFYESLQEKKPFTKLTNTGISDNLTNVFEFAKEYEQKQLLLHNVSQKRELLVAYEKHHYRPSEWALASKQCEKEIDQFLATNCG